MGESRLIAYEPKGTYVDYIVAVCLFFFMAWLFIGIAIASDLFMNAIEKICGATRTIKESKEEDGVVIISTKQVLIWNDTVANLTLMALGSSAPEILLSVIEICLGLGDQNPGELGPGTIIGSASFNLMIISALCIVCLKDGATSRIKLYSVFTVTTVTSLFAYLWMVVVLQWVSPDEVTLWEALLTLLYFPILAAISYWADQNFCINGKRRLSISSAVEEDEEERALFFADEDLDNLYDAEGNVDRMALKNFYWKLKDEEYLTQEEITTILATKLVETKHHNSSWYRSKAAKVLLGSGTGMPALDDRLQEVVKMIGEKRRSSVAARGSVNLLKPAVTSPETYLKMAVVEFQAAALAVPESVGIVQVNIVRSGKEDIDCMVKVDTLDGTAKAGKQYEAVSKLIPFEAYVKEFTVEVPIIDNKIWNPDSNFFLKLSIPTEYQSTVCTGPMRVIEIIIMDDDKPGRLTFVKRGYRFKDKEKIGFVEVDRTDGTDGVITAKWKIIAGPKCTLVSPDLGGTLEFLTGELRKVIEIPFQPHQDAAVGIEQMFDIELYALEGGAKLGKFPITTCALTGDEAFKLEITNILTAAILESEKADENVSYKDQILQSIYPNDGDVKNAKWSQWVSHILVFPFKVTFSLIPPPYMAGGWLCFIISLLAIGLLTKFVGDTASSFGPCLGIDHVITAITFVALGTSLPDTFASMISAKNDKTADNAIGNVTGSNSVNVFLGLGLPWTIGAIYYSIAKNEAGEYESFCVPSGTLGFNVVMFTLCALVTVALLVFRRYSPLCGKAELGGPTCTKWVTATIMILLWGLYILLACLQIKYEDMADPFVGKRKATKCSELYQIYRLKRELKKKK